ncbi:MAG: acyl-CoA desaturase [Cyclobacteriaceae bacterium]
MTNSIPQPRFPQDSSGFFNILQARVNKYFSDYQLGKSGGTRLIVKSLLMLILFLSPYFIILSLQPNILLATVLLIIMGIGKAGVGMAVMHDALHGSLSKRQWLNNLFGASIYILGGNVINWKIQHNVLHHTYPNVYKIDEDVSTKGMIVRLSPQSKPQGIQKFQHMYTLPLYGLMTLSFLVKDFKQLFRYNNNGITRKQGKKPTIEIIKLISTKVAYLSAFLILPIFLTAYSWLHVIVGFLIFHAVAGLILSIVFQLAHSVETTDYPEINAGGNLNDSWAIHQLKTTSNFAPKSRWVSWYTGGLNHQIEHHLFPHISHVHYDNIAEIVKKTAAEFRLPYHSQATVLSALKSHIRMLKELGTANQLPQVG